MKRIFALIMLLSFGCNSSDDNSNILGNFSDKTPIKPTIEYGFEVDSIELIKKEIQSGESLGAILVENGVSYGQVDQIARSSRNTDFDVRYLKAGHPYVLFCDKDSMGQSFANIFIYEQDKINFVVYDFRDTLKIYRDQKEVDIKLIEVAGVIQKGSSFFLTGASLGMSDRLCEIISDEIYCWTLDFRHVQPGDEV